MIETLASIEAAKPEAIDTVINLKPWQAKFIRTKARYPANVAGWGTGKSLSGIGRAMRMSEQYPDNLGVIFRKEYTDLRDSTVKDFQTNTGITVSSARDVVFPNKSIILFRHIEELNNIQNMNLGWFWIEQAEELDTDDQFFTLFGRLRRKGTEQSGFVTANTNGHDWIYKLWKAGGLVEAIRQLMKEHPELFVGVNSPEEMVKLYEATTFDNQDVLSPEFMLSLRILEKKKPKLYKRFVLNSWDESDTAEAVIQPSWVELAKKQKILVRAPIRRVISIDVARSEPGEGDKSVFYAIENNKEIGREEHEVRNTMSIVGLALIFAEKIGKQTPQRTAINSFAVDEIGVGAGVADRLSELEKEVIFVNAAQREAGSGYYNRRAEIHDYAADLFEAGQVQLDPANDVLAEELSWAKTHKVLSNKVYQVQSKAEIKETYGRSPDHSDAFLNGLWALKHVKVAVKADAYAQNASRSNWNRRSADAI